MTAELHARIKAAVDEERSRIEYDCDAQDSTEWASLMDHRRRLCDHADDVLARHSVAEGTDRCAYCTDGLILREGRTRDGWWPCPEVRALATAWLGEGWGK